MSERQQKIPAADTQRPGDRSHGDHDAVQWSGYSGPGVLRQRRDYDFRYLSACAPAMAFVTRRHIKKY